MNQRKPHRHRLITWQGTRGDTLSTQPYFAPPGCQWGDTPGGGPWHLPVMTPARNYFWPWGTVPTDQIYINPTQQVRPTPLQFDLSLLNTSTHPQRTEDLLCSQQQFPWKVCLQMGLLQILQAGDKDFVHSTFLDYSVCYSLLLSTSVFITRK